MPLKYPPEWKYEGFPHELPDAAHREFLRLIEMMVEGVDSPKTIYEDFKRAYGYTSASSNTSWAETDMHSAIQSLTDNAARYVVAFYAGMESVKQRGIDVPTVKTLNRILAENDVSLLIKPPYLLSREGDIEFVPGDVSDDAFGKAFVSGPEIGRGGFGEVFKVTRKTKVGEYHFAMKVLKPSVFIENKERANRRFIRELRMLEKLQHRAIVQLIEAGMTAEQHPYILMPFIDGHDIRTALSEAPPTVVYEAFTEISRALEFAHEQGAIHRDLKPSNILVRTADRQPFILDFGCAYMIDEVDDSLTTTLIGTPGYIPREVLDDPKHRDPRQDLYAVGVILYEVIMSVRPYFDNYKPVVAKFPQFKGVDSLIQELIAPEDDRIMDAGRICEILAKL